MSEFFLELFSEEVPPNLQINARKKLYLDLKNFFDENNIIIKGSSISFSSPNRIVINFSNISKEIVKKSAEIRGPSINAKQEALDGFLKSHNINISQVLSKKTEKEVEKLSESSSGIEDLLKINKKNNESSVTGTNKSLEQSILKKIKNN